MPASSAARTHATACSSSTWPPWVIQLPYEISLTVMPLRPRRRNSTTGTLRRARSASRSNARRAGGPGSDGVADLDPGLGHPQLAQLAGPAERVPAQGQRADLLLGELVPGRVGDPPPEQHAFEQDGGQHGHAEQADHALQL